MTEDKGHVLKVKKDKLKARAANKKGYRDLAMSTEGISLNIVENATSDELTKGDLEKACERLERRWNPNTREDKVEAYTIFLNYKLENTRQRPMDWLTFMEKKHAELMNTGHIMDDETLITHLLNSLPQSEYKGAILVIKDELRKGPVDLPEIEQVLEDKYQAIKMLRAGKKRRMIMPPLQAPPTRKGPRKHSKDVVDTVENLDTKQLTVPTRKVIKIRVRKQKYSKRESSMAKGTPKAKDI